MSKHTKVLHKKQRSCPDCGARLKVEIEYLDIEETDTEIKWKHLKCKGCGWFQPIVEETSRRV